MPFIVGRNASAARRPNAADLACDRRDHSDASAARSAACGRFGECRRDHSDASAAMRRPLVGRYAADYEPTLSVHCTVVDTHMIFAYVNKFDVSSRLRQILTP